MVIARLASARVDFAPVASRLDDYAAAWRDGYERACRATHASGEQSPMLHDLRVSCLDRRRVELDALTTTLASPLDATTATHAAQAAWQLPEVAACGDVEALARGAPLPPFGPERLRVDALASEAAATRIELGLGRYREARAHAEALFARLDGIADAATRALVLRVVGKAREFAGDWKGDETIRRAEIRAATVSRNDRTAAEAWTQLAEVVARDPTRTVAAKELLDVADTEATRVAANDDLVADILKVRAGIAHDAGDHQKARELLHRALELRERALGSDHPNVAPLLDKIASVEKALGNPAAQVAAVRRALAIRERAYGSDHPETALGLVNLGIAAMITRQLDLAEASMVRAIAIYEKRLGTNDYHLAEAHEGLAAVLVDRGRHADALAHYQRALAIWEAPAHDAAPRQIGALRVQLAGSLRSLHRYKEARAAYDRALGELRVAFGPDDRSVLACLEGLAGLEGEMGDLKAARVHEEEVVELTSRTLGPDHPDMAVRLANLADTYSDLGMYLKARPLFERSIAIDERTFGRDHPNVALTLLMLANNAASHGDPETARRALERALPILEHANGDPYMLATARMILAKLVWAEDRERARALARRAAETFARSDRPEAAEQLRELATWRASH
jgi:tetratricopeptide (TPR) repeat protein